jgi:hypothetical protein
VVTEEGGANKILDLETGKVRRELGRHPSGEVRALSGDGRWAASCGWHSDRVRLWNAGTGQMVHEWVVGKRTYVFFTPDSRTLIISRGDGFSFHDVASLQPTGQLPREVALYPGHVAFSPDGELMAVEMAPAVMHLKEVATGRTIARFEDPHGDRATWQGFTPDGTQLVVVSNHPTAIHIWDLRAIRERLKDMHLDWDWPEFEPAAPADQATEPATITVLPREPDASLTRWTIGRIVLSRGQSDIDRFACEDKGNPDSPLACTNLAWAYLTAPEGQRDVKAALPLAEKAVRLASGPEALRDLKAPATAVEKAVQLASGIARARFTLGVAYYRTERYRDAVDVLRPNLESREDRTLAFDLYFLAMSYQRLGEKERARDYYDWASRSGHMHRGLDATEIEELTAFRAEAGELLGIKSGK